MLGRTKKSGQKGGVLETTIMRSEVQRTEIRRILQCSDGEFAHWLLDTIHSNNTEEGLESFSCMCKKDLEPTTYTLLLEYLNTTNRYESIRYMAASSIDLGDNDVVVQPQATHYRTVTVHRKPSPCRIAGSDGKERVNEGNTWSLANMKQGLKAIVQIRWIFKPLLLIDGNAEDADSCYIHVRVFTLVSKETVLGHNHPSSSCFDDLRIYFTRTVPESEEQVLSLQQLRAQTIVVPVRTELGSFLGFKLI